MFGILSNFKKNESRDLMMQCKDLDTALSGEESHDIDGKVLPNKFELLNIFLLSDVRSLMKFLQFLHDSNLNSLG